MVCIGVAMLLLVLLSCVHLYGDVCLDGCVVRAYRDALACYKNAKASPKFTSGTWCAQRASIYFLECGRSSGFSNMFIGVRCH